MTELLDGQYELGGLLFGEGTPYVVTKYEDGGVPERRTEDTANSYEDGTRFGRDYFAGLAPSWELIAETVPGESWDTVGAFLRAFKGHAVRRTPGAVQYVRVKRPGRPTCRVYGRPGNCTPVYSKGTGVGLVPIVADFRAADDHYYGDEVRTSTVTMLPAPGGGFRFPARFPWRTTGSAEQHDTVTNAGDADTWHSVTFTGPVNNPALDLLDDDGGIVWTIALGVTLGVGQSITVSTWPWARTVLREDGSSVPGKRTRECTPSPLCSIPPGTWRIRFRGGDPSGTATAAVTWLDAYDAA